MKATALLGVLLLLCGCSSEPKSNWPSEPLTETAVKAALAKVDDFMIYELDEDDILKYITCKDGAITISIKPDSIWDETHFAKQVAYSIVGYSEVLFKHPEVKQVKLSAYLEFIDKMGKSTEELAAMILWTDAGREVRDRKSVV